MRADLQRRRRRSISTLHPATVADAGERIDVEGATVIVIDLDAARDDEMQALGAPDDPHRRLAAGGGRSRQRLRRQCRRALCCRCGSRTSLVEAGSAGGTGAHLRARGAGRRRPKPRKREIFAFLPAVGGAGVTTLAIQTALLLLNSNSKQQA